MLNLELMNNIFSHLQFDDGVLEKIIYEYTKFPERMYGCLDEQTNPVIDLSRVSHKITKLTPTEFEYEILETRCGQILKQTLGMVKFKPRLIGEYENGKIINATLISIDACYE